MTKVKRKRKKQIEIYLIDDDHMTFTEVVDILSNVLPECSPLRAEQIAIITHYKGLYKKYTGPITSGMLLQTMLITRGLQIVTKIL